MSGKQQSLRLQLPATSANLGPGFDALGLAMALYLTIDASVAEQDAIVATGRDAEICGRVDDSLILTTYREVVESAGASAPPLRLLLHNEIPLGMGCGSSAAALLAGVLLASHFGGLGWSEQAILEEACRREGHPDNVAACWAGGLTASAVVSDHVITSSFGADLDWKLWIVLPSASLSTKQARALLPDSYSQADAVANIQSVALLVAAFALHRSDLLRYGMRDTMHQPYRMEACPLLPRLLPLSHEPGILGVALSGAGPSVLVITEPEMDRSRLEALIRASAGESVAEILETGIAGPCSRSAPNDTFIT